MNREELKLRLGLTDDELNVKLAKTHKRERRKDQDHIKKDRVITSFKELCENKPDAGDTLYMPENIDVTGEDNGEYEPVNVVEDFRIDENDNPQRVLYCNAAIDKKATGWYLTNKDKGLKCIILASSHDHVREDEDGLFVYTLNVVRRTASGKALLCEVID